MLQDPVTLISGPFNKFDATADPTVNDDSSSGFEPGSLWLNLTTRILWICDDASVGAAKWRIQTNLGHHTYLVGPVSQAPYQGVQAAIDAAVAAGYGNSNPAIVYLLPGTYAGNLALKPGIYLRGITYPSTRPGIPTTDVVIDGHLTFAYDDAGTTYYSTKLQSLSIYPTTSGSVLTLSGSSRKSVTIENTKFTYTFASGRAVDASAQTQRFAITITGSAVGQTNVSNLEPLVDLTQAGSELLIYGSLVWAKGGIVVSANDCVVIINCGDRLKDYAWVYGTITVGAGTTNCRLQIERTDITKTGSYEIVIDGTLSSLSYFWQVFSGSSYKEPITIGGANGSTFKERPTGVAGDVSISDGQRWVIQPVPVPVRANQDMLAKNTILDQDLACDTAILYTPTRDGLVKVLVNGVAVEVGDGVKTADCYFSSDSGVTARYVKDIVAGDKMYWMGSVALYQLSVSTDKVSFVYTAQQP